MKKSTLKEILDWIFHIALAAILGILIVLFIGRLTIVDGNSMNPTLENQNVLIIENITPRFGTLKQGDIVVMKIPEILGSKRQYAIKRIIATENQHIEIRDGMVFVDGVKLDEDYVNYKETLVDNELYSDMVVPKGSIYVMGDNRIPDKSKDSRSFGVVNKSRVIGKCWVRIFPFSEAGPVR